MWIIPKPITSAFVPDTGALISDSEEQSHAFAQSLIQRSKVTPAPTWLRRLRQDSWIQLLSGRMLRASHTDSFTAAYTSSLGATLANHSQPLGSGLEKTTPATSGPGSQMELLSCDPACASSRTSKDTLPLDCVTSSTTWASWVTERRGAYSRRLKSALLTRGRESSSWPTSSARDWKGCYTTLQRKDGKMRGDLLPDAVNIEEMHGRHALEKNSLDGSRPELWRTPQASEAGARVETLYTKDGKPAVPGQRAYRKTPSGKLVLQSQTINQQVEMVDRVKAWAVQSWPTPSAMDGQRPSETPQQWETRNAAKKASNPNLGQLHRPLTVAVQWATPRAEHDSGMHRGQPDTLHSQIKTWPTPSASGDSNPGSNADPIKWQKIADAKKAQGIHKQLLLTTKVAMGHPGKLNPRWVETLMGVPVGWTMATCSHPLAIEPMNSGFSETASSQPQQP